SSPVHAQQADVTGAWLGTLKPGPIELRLVFHFERKEDGTYSATLDSPDQGARGIPVSETAVTGDSVLVTLAMLNAVYRGQIQPDGKRMTGTFTQQGMSFPLDLERTDDPPGE